MQPMFFSIAETRAPIGSFLK